MNKESMIRVENLKKEYHVGTHKVEVLTGIDLSIEEGEMVSIVGDSGVGKSTFLHLLGLLEQPTDGSIQINNRETSRLSGDQLSDFRNTHIGFVFQFHHLLPEFTALENAMLPVLIGRKSRKLAEKKAKELLIELGLENRLHHKPGELSGGEQQRTALARALATEPRVLLADEPTGNLDKRTSSTIHNLIREVIRKRKLTCIVVTHNEELAERADRMLKMEDGKIYCPSLKMTEEVRRNV